MNIVCVKIGTKYSSELANRLYAMCKKNISTPFSFYCYTDDPTELCKDIITIPYVEQSLDVIVFNKLYLFSDDISKVLGDRKTIFFDLDIIIKDNIDAIVNHEPSGLSVIKTVWRSIRKHHMFHPYYMHDVNSSCMVWQPGTTVNIWNHFFKDADRFMTQYHWGMDSYLYYEHNIRGTLPTDLFYSHYYGVDEKYMIENANDRNVVDMRKLKHITDPIPVVLMNGPTTDADYEIYRKFFQF